jgi:putative ABC transport system permease protein
MLLSSALHTFKRAKQYYLTTVFTLAVTLSMVLSVFSLVDLVFFAPLPYQNSDNLYLLEGNLKTKTGQVYDGSTNAQIMAYIEKNNNIFTDFATFHRWTDYKLYDQANRPEVQVILSSSNLFDVLGVKPELGRLFNNTETFGSKQAAVVIGYRLWQKTYHGDKNIIGKKIQLNQRRFTVIGIAPDNLVLPQYRDINEAVWIPMDMDEVFDAKTAQGFMGAFKGVVRLKADLDLVQVTAQLNQLTMAGAKLYSPKVLKDYALSAGITQFRTALQGDSGSIVLMLLVGVLLLMVMALINLSSMQIAKAIAKIKTVAISFAFGASNKQLFIESFKHNLLVIGIAVLIALSLTLASFSLMQTLAQDSIQRLDTLAFSVNTLLVSVLLTMVIALLYSYLELRVVNEKNLVTSLQSSGKGVGKQMSAGASHLLIGLQVAFSFIVLIAACHVALQTLSEALRDNGINTQNKWALTISYGNIKKPAERINFHLSLSEQLSKLSSVNNVEQASQSRIPLNLNTDSIYDDNKNYLASSRKTRVSNGYLSELALKIIGKNFSQGDSELKNYPVIINQRLADVISDNTQAVLGKKISLNEKNLHEIIAVVANTYVPGATHYETMEVYTPRKFNGWRSHSFLLTTNNSALLEQQVRDLVTKLDARLDITRLTSLEQLFAQAKQQQLTAAWLAIILASVSLIMVIIGVNGIVNYMVQVRRYDLGVKLAMGANNSRLLKDSLSELMLPIGMSLLFAFSLSFLALGYSRSQPDLTVEANWLLVIGIIAGFAIIAMLASYLPIKKILTGDPIKALRNE